MKTAGSIAVEASKYEAVSRRKLEIYKEARDEITSKIREALIAKEDEATLTLVKILIANQDDIEIEVANIKDLKRQRESAAMESAQGLLDFELDEYLAGLRERCGR